jgi:ribonuclease G
VAILEDDRLVELLVDRPEAQRILGNIYYGRVEAVLPGMQAAFVDIGLEKSAFLHASDIVEPDDDEFESEDSGNGGGRPSRGSRRPAPNIQEHLTKGQAILVQVTKEPISTKGSRVTAQISLPGRFLVYLPSASRVGVSRKIESRETRTKLRKIVRSVLPEGSGGVICRTAAKDLSEDLIRRELKSLVSLWKKIQKKTAASKPPTLVQQEASLTRGIIRDVFSDKVDNLYVDSREVIQEIKKYLKQIDPDLVQRVHLYRDPTESLFDHQGVEAEIEHLFNTRVDLPTGGYVIIEQTEALVSIDVNTGSYTGRRDPEKTILKTNMEAAREIARQLRLRDFGGIIVIDFIDMEQQAHREKLFHELRACVAVDRARTRVYRVTDLGLIQMTRQRVRPSLVDSMTTICPACEGMGRVFKPEVVARHLDRSLRRVANDAAERQVMVRLHPEVALYLLEDEPEFMKQVKAQAKVQIEIRDDPTIAIDEFRLVSQPAGRDVTDKYAAA